MKILIRASETDKTISGGERFGDYRKSMILKKCWISLMANLDNSDSVMLFHNNVKNTTVNWLEDKCPTLIETVPAGNRFENFENAYYALEKELKNETDENALFAILDDDFLWTTNAIRVIKDFYYNWTGWKGFVTPNDSVLEYIKHNDTIVTVGPDRHWKVVSKVSFNLIGTKRIFTENLDVIKKAMLNISVEDLNKIKEKTNSLVPLPGVATHCAKHDMAPLVNWEYIWRGIEI